MDDNPYRAPQTVGSRKRRLSLPALILFAVVVECPGALALLFMWAHAGMIDPQIKGWDRTAKMIERMFSAGFLPGTVIGLVLLTVPWLAVLAARRL